MQVADVAALARVLTANVGRVVVGKEGPIRLLVAALLAERHVLIEDVPGTGKTTLVKSLARSLGATMGRLQFTPDLLPADVTGFSAFNPQSGEFTFRPGPIFSQLLLVDEVNRASPKTQASLLECMEERQATVDGVSHPLPRPFLVLATQNPVEYEGTFPLPEAQLDRFGVRLRLGYPSAAEEALLLESRAGGDPLADLVQVASVADVIVAQEAVRQVHLDPVLQSYVVELCSFTRRHPDVALGASPRCSLALADVARALAAMAGRSYTLPDDVKQAATAVMAHRILLTPGARWRGDESDDAPTPESVVAEALRRVPVPAEDRRREA